MIPLFVDGIFAKLCEPVDVKRVFVFSEDF
jgi:hypothetical protein